MSQSILQWDKYSDEEEYTEQDNNNWTIGEFMKALINDGKVIISCVITEYNDKGVAVKGYVVVN